MLTLALCAAAFAAGVYTGLSKDKIIAWAKSIKAKLPGGK